MAMNPSLSPPLCSMKDKTAIFYSQLSCLWSVWCSEGRFWVEGFFKFQRKLGTFHPPQILLFSFPCFTFYKIRMKCWVEAQLTAPSTIHHFPFGTNHPQLIIFVSSYFGVRNTIAGSWSFPGAAGQLPGPSSGRPASQPEPFSWLTSQHLQPASYTHHLQHRSSPHTRWYNNTRHTPVLSSFYVSLLMSWLMLAFFFLLAPTSSTDTPHTPSLYSRLEASTEQPEGDDVFFDMLVKCQVREKNLLDASQCRLSHITDIHFSNVYFTSL